MNLGKYIKDYFFIMIMFLVFLGLTAIMMSVFAVPWQIVVMEIVIAFLFLGIVFAWDFSRRKSYYDNLLQNMEGLDQKYLVLETVKRPSFYEGQLYYDLLWETHKSMREQVKAQEKSMLDFKEYIELWVHEVKLPISGLLLMCHNSKNHIDKRFVGQIKKLDNYTDQVLYYARLEHAGEDYQFSKVSLETIIHNVAVKTKDLLLESGVALQVQAIDRGVVTDTKWMEFIIGQIFSNSIKYKKESEPGVINIFVTECAAHDSQSEAEYMSHDGQSEAEYMSHDGQSEAEYMSHDGQSGTEYMSHDSQSEVEHLSHDGQSEAEDMSYGGQSKAEYISQDEQNKEESASPNERTKSEAVRNTERSNKKITLHIRDNGIGIVQGDLRRVWNKTFTGQNGRKRAKSTGMGLYIVKGLCDKLGNDICIESQEGEYTDVQITFQTCNLLSR